MAHISDNRTRQVKHTFIKNGVYYYRRRVPVDVAQYYASQLLAFSLGTKSARTAEILAGRLSGQLERMWFQLRLENHLFPQIIPRRLQHSVPPTPLAEIASQDGPMLTEVLEKYVALKAPRAGRVFEPMARRSVGYFTEVAGEKPITSYRRVDAIAMRDLLIARGLAGSSVKRATGAVRAVFSYGFAEYAIDAPNPFSALIIDGERGTTERQPVPVPVIKTILAECLKADDELRHLIALITDTGLRLSEAAGLLKGDVLFEDGQVKAIAVRPHKHRRLKTKGSQRTIPLVGASRWAVERRLANSGNALFPKYCRPPYFNSNSASAALNKWLNPRVPKGCSVHSLRHSIRDRLRAVECPSDIMDAIGGWKTDGVGNTYGTGYALPVLEKYMKLIVIDGRYTTISEA